MTPLVKGLGILFGFPVVLSIGFFAYFTATGEDRMTRLCQQVVPGMTAAQLKEFAQENRLTGPNKDAGVTVLGDTRSYGRHACMVTLEAGVVKLSKYTFSD
jgi:hypothetical protein